LIDFSFLRRKAALPPKADERHKTPDTRRKTQLAGRHKQPHLLFMIYYLLFLVTFQNPSKAKKRFLIDCLNWAYPPKEWRDKLDLKPCPAGRMTFIY
jgi:hypothetical protein